jgi:hypothetical protein
MGPTGSLGGEVFDGQGIAIKCNAFVPAAQQPAHHVGAHASEPDHPKLHHSTPARQRRLG